MKLMMIIVHMKVIHVEPYDDGKMHIDDKTYVNGKVNYNSKAFFNDFWYDNSYELHDEEETYYDNCSYDEYGINKNDKP
eukprot:4818775-Ditylum_brightwellii.AAC.1